MLSTIAEKLCPQKIGHGEEWIRKDITLTVFGESLVKNVFLKQSFISGMSTNGY